ncbi:uncharacterized protein MONBRDRAFT_29219 [Monosiga brevicollis MX1]|uniref:Serine protease n=1 Tax=Monosiga brevicollis TaxID=81824 RepID=A9VAG6_MONBE|nr:uncharacterized protein MONBRDRAFT_29219 [Monosiga brevicollis MX1]EDQ85482.1 predicted protein [Monosiga brevicollis MX1]|eukprot:XP_001749673.1 hypothetical protein [Monosiga brevicollis MX1]
MAFAPVFDVNLEEKWDNVCVISTEEKLGLGFYLGNGAVATAAHVVYTAADAKAAVFNFPLLSQKQDEEFVFGDGIERIGFVYELQVQQADSPTPVEATADVAILRLGEQAGYGGTSYGDKLEMELTKSMPNVKVDMGKADKPCAVNQKLYCLSIIDGEYTPVELEVLEIINADNHKVLRCQGVVSPGASGGPALDEQGSCAGIVYWSDETQNATFVTVLLGEALNHTQLLSAEISAYAFWASMKVEDRAEGNAKELKKVCEEHHLKFFSFPQWCKDLYDKVPSGHEEEAAVPQRVAFQSFAHLLTRLKELKLTVESITDTVKSYANKSSAFLYKGQTGDGHGDYRPELALVVTIDNKKLKERKKKSFKVLVMVHVHLTTFDYKKFTVSALNFRHAELRRTIKGQTVSESDYSNNVTSIDWEHFQDESGAKAKWASGTTLNETQRKTLNTLMKAVIIAVNDCEFQNKAGFHEIVHETTEINTLLCNPADDACLRHIEQIAKTAMTKIDEMSQNNCRVVKQTATAAKEAAESAVENAADKKAVAAKENAVKAHRLSSINDPGTAKDPLPIVWNEL